MVSSRHSEESFPAGTDVDKLLNTFRRLMWERVGIVREGEGLRLALRRIKGWEKSLRDHGRTRRDWEIQNMVTVGRLVATAAVQRRHSIGAHFRSDEVSSKRPGQARHIQLASVPALLPLKTALATHPRKKAESFMATN
jgi:aspartate oxidase